MPDDPVPAPATMAEQLAAIERDHRKFLQERSPFSAAIWIAAMKPAEVVLANVQARLADGETVLPSDDPGERDVRESALIAIGEALVYRAMRGDTKAAGLIADRIEGRVGVRPGERDTEQERSDATVRAAIEAVVRGMTAAARPQEGDTARPVDVVATTTPAPNVPDTGNS